MTIFLIRHAHAGSRSGYAGSDFDRPLSEKGRAQADHLRTLLATHEIEAICTSDYVRCEQTVEGVADERNLPIQHRAELREGAEVADTMAFMESFGDTNAVLCSHGDVIPKVMRRLASAGRLGDAPALSSKGSMWELETDAEGRVLTGRYHPPLHT